MIVALGGRPWTGKSTLARSLAKALPGVLLDKSELRRVLFPRLIAPSQEQNDRIYEFLLQAAVWHLETTPRGVVVLDGRPLTRIRDVLSLHRFASGIGQMLQIIECVCPEDVARQRGRGFASVPPAEHAHPAPHNEVAEPIPGPKIVVDSQLPPEHCLSLALEALAGKRANEHREPMRESRPSAAHGG
jgi:predicted kinase